MAYAPCPPWEIWRLARLTRRRADCPASRKCLGREAERLYLRRQWSRRKAGLVLERREELVRLRQAVPDLREEQPAPIAVAQHNTVDLRPQSVQEVGFIPKCNRAQVAQNRNRDL